VRGSQPIVDAIVEVNLKYRPDIVFVHRDAEKLSAAVRLAEIPSRDAVVPIVPIRMTEAWLLIDEGAIRQAAGNPNGKTALALPPVKQLEELPDPKAILRALLISASEYSGRRRRKFDHAAAFRRLADLIEDFSPLLRLSAFGRFCEDLTAVLGRSSLPDHTSLSASDPFKYLSQNVRIGARATPGFSSIVECSEPTGAAGRSARPPRPPPPRR
jgi:hypothetical protein